MRLPSEQDRNDNRPTDSASIRWCFSDASLAAAFADKFETRNTQAGVVILLPSFFVPLVQQCRFLASALSKLHAGELGAALIIHSPVSPILRIMQSLDRGNSALAKLLTVAASIEAESRISELHARIDEQRRIIEDLAIEGHDHDSAMIVLDSLQLSLSLYLQERLRLRSKLTETEKASAASGQRGFIAISRQGSLKLHFKPVPE